MNNNQQLCLKSNNITFRQFVIDQFRPKNKFPYVLMSFQWCHNGKCKIIGNEENQQMQENNIKPVQVDLLVKLMFDTQFQHQSQ